MRDGNHDMVLLGQCNGQTPDFAGVWETGDTCLRVKAVVGGRWTVHTQSGGSNNDNAIDTL